MVAATKAGVEVLAVRIRHTEIGLEVAEQLMIPSKKKKVHQRVHHYTLSTTKFRKKSACEQFLVVRAFRQWYRINKIISLPVIVLTEKRRSGYL